MADTKDNPWLAALIGALLLPGVLILRLPVLLLHAWAARDLWGWFAVPLGIPAITLWHAYGIGLLTSLYTHQYSATPEGKLPERLTTAVTSPLLFWGIGWFIQRYGM